MSNKIPIVNAGQVIVRRKTDGRYLVLRASQWPERPDRSQKPDLPGGEIEPGETLQGGTTRELEEETGIQATVSELQVVYALTYFSERENIALNRIIYLYEIDEDTEIKLSWEHEAYMWLSADELLHLDDIRKPYPEVFHYLYKIGLLV